MTTRELTPAEQRQHDLELAAAAREKLERSAEGFPQAGETWHVLTTGASFAGRVLSRGDEFQPTQEQIDSTFDRVGSSPLSSWGKPGSGLQRGPFPADQPVLIHGSVDWQIARDAALERAKRSEDPDAAYRAVSAQYGPPADAVTWVDLPDTRSSSKWAS